ncbi:MAG TPA: HAMP domain-containing sensor histidine kinase [Polyangiaceae bacterium]|nr:HAMP domain-containing sensor histidine kinase [Polyangiaceae bacterium]
MEDDLEPEIIGELLGLLAHDLRNPLSALHSNVGFLGSALEGMDPEMQEALSDTLVSCDGLAHIIDNMEVLALALSGRSALPATRFDLRPLLSEAVARNQALARSHDVELVLDSELATPAHVQSHRDMLARAIGNLVRNSIQHASGGPSVHVSLQSSGSDYVVRVEDGGMPLSEQLRTEGFTARGQLVAKSARGGRYSRGLGLFSARVSAEAAGAKVRAATDSPDSNLFELVLPRA